MKRISRRKMLGGSVVSGGLVAASLGLPRMLLAQETAAGTVI